MITIAGLVLVILGLVLPSSMDPFGGFLAIIGILVSTVGGGTNT
jgi:hypothetical protein